MYSFKQHTYSIMSMRWAIGRKSLANEARVIVDELFAIGKQFENTVTYIISLGEGNEAVNLEAHISTQKILSRLETIAQELHTLVESKIQVKKGILNEETTRALHSINDELENTILKVGKLVQYVTNPLGENSNSEVIERLERVVFHIQSLKNEIFSILGPGPGPLETPTPTSNNGDGQKAASAVAFFMIFMAMLPRALSVLSYPARATLYACSQQIPLLLFISLFRKVMDWSLDLARWLSLFGAWYLVVNRQSRVYKIFRGLKQYAVLDSPAPTNAEYHPEMILCNILWTITYGAVNCYLSGQWYLSGGRLSFPLAILASLMRSLAYVGIRAGIMILTFVIFGPRRVFRVLSPLFRVVRNTTQFQIKLIWDFACETSVWRYSKLAIFKSSIFDLLCYLFDGQDEFGSSQEEYSYNPLNEQTKEIRLLQFSKKYPWSRPIIEICEHSLDSAPAYDAISYTWDKQEPDRSLQLQQGVIKTTKNAIQIIMERASWRQVRHLWIDAVCIDQSNTPEKQSQIQLMRQIYRCATRTIAWVSYDPIPFYDLWLLSLSNDLSRGSIRNMLVHMIASFDNTSVQLVQRIMAIKKTFLAQNYWSRGWIVQEFALAREVHIMYGGHFMSLDDLRLCISPQPFVPSMNLAGQMIKECKDGTEFQPVVKKDGAVYNFLKEPQSTIKTLLFARDIITIKKFASLSTVLSIGTHFNTFIPHDKIYSVLGMLDEDFYDLRPDYEIPIECLHLKVATLLSHKSWDFVLRCAGVGYVKSISTLPR